MKLKTMAMALTALAAVGSATAAGEHLKSVNPAYINNNIPAGQDF